MAYEYAHGQERLIKSPKSPATQPAKLEAPINFDQIVHIVAKQRVIRPHLYFAQHDGGRG